MTLFEAIILGVVQGLTEFLPVSSSGHLILARTLFGFSPEGGLAFDAVLHFATALAVVGYFRKDILQLIGAFPSVVKGIDHSHATLLKAIIVATIPAVCVGFLLEDYMATVFRNEMLVALTLLLGALIMWSAEKYAAHGTDMSPNLSRGLAIGLFQTLALIPGMSRSGMAIAGGMYMHLTREAATRFAFLLAVPLLLGAGAKKILDVATGSEMMDPSTLLAGGITAFLVGLVVIHYFLRFVRTQTLMPFVWYRVLLAAVVLVTLFY